MQGHKTNMQGTLIVLQWAHMGNIGCTNSTYVARRVAMGAQGHTRVLKGFKGYARDTQEDSRGIKV